jgi:hypothetical protein
MLSSLIPRKGTETISTCLIMPCRSGRLSSLIPRKGTETEHRIDEGIFVEIVAIGNS